MGANAANLLARAIERSRIPPIAWVVILCTLLTLPAIFLRGAHYEEGTTIAIARGLSEDGIWPDTFRFGERLSERPAAVAWLIGLAGMLTGSIPVWLARLPTTLALFAGALMIFGFVRRRTSVEAALIAVGCFALSPMVLQKLVTAESDLIVAVVLFGALIVFLHDVETGPTPRNWIAITAIVSVASLIKGPQPLGYFFLGTGAFALIRADWPRLIALMLAGSVAALTVGAWYVAVYQPGDGSNWMSQSRMTAIPLQSWIVAVGRTIVVLMVSLLPGVLLVVRSAAGAFRDPQRNGETLQALILYAGVCSAVLVMWPGANARYAMPAVLAVAAAAGLAVDRAGQKASRTVAVVLVLLGALAMYQLAWNWVAMPVFPDKFRQQALLGQQVAEVATPGSTLLVSQGAMDHNYLSYVPHRIRVVPFAEIAASREPGWAVLTPGEFESLAATKQKIISVRHATVDPVDRWHLVLVQR